ncbi:MAG: response regulator transcription factor [Deferribacterales bacterium]
MLKDLSVLYIEDDPLTSVLMKMQFERKFKVLYMAVDGKEGVEIYEKYNPDIVITDLIMPEMNGYEVIDYIRSKDKDKIIIAVTACMEETIRPDVNFYMMKPVVYNDIIAILRELGLDD